MSATPIDFSKYEAAAPAAIDFSKYEGVPPGLGMDGGSLTSAASVPNARIRNMTVDPVKNETSALGAFYHGAKFGAEASMIPAAPALLPASLGEVPGLLAGLIGATAGGVGAKALAQTAGAGELGQEAAGDVGSLAGGALTGAAANFAADKARAIYSALPDVLQKKLLGVASPRLKNAMELWDALGELAERPANAKPPLDATGENVAYAGAPRPKPQPELDATGENKPFAGGMDEWTPKAAKARLTLTDLNSATLVKPAAPPSAVAPAPAAAIPGAAGSMVRSVAAKSSGDPLLDRLRAIAQNIETQETKKAATPEPEDDLTDILLQSLKQVRAKKSVAVQ